MKVDATGSLFFDIIPFTVEALVTAYRAYGPVTLTRASSTCDVFMTSESMP